MKVARVIVAVVLTQGLGGCDSQTAFRRPFMPTPLPNAGPPAGSTPTLRRFTDRTSGFSTTDVRDAQEQVVQFTTSGDLVWIADGTHFSGYGAVANAANFINAPALCSCWFDVRFGIKDGERRAYVTAIYRQVENPGSVVDLNVSDGVLVMSRTNVFPPGTYTLSGVVTEKTSSGHRSLEGVSLIVDVGEGYQASISDTKGYYEFPGLYAENQRVGIDHEGYQRFRHDVLVTGDTRLDIELVRR